MLRVLWRKKSALLARCGVHQTMGFGGRHRLRATCPVSTAQLEAIIWSARAVSHQNGTVVRPLRAVSPSIPSAAAAPYNEGSSLLYWGREEEWARPDGTDGNMHAGGGASPTWLNGWTHGLTHRVDVSGVDERG